MAGCVVSCSLRSQILETAGTHRDHEPFQTGPPRLGVMGSLWIKENMLLIKLPWCGYYVESNKILQKIAMDSL